ncbi:MAG: ribonuclease III, partial [Candidatus Aminicenantes bacterium]|nr:ribonuclease III [Candidatus Aminicenantes bacterium]
MDDLLKKINYRFRDEGLLLSALTHKSFNEGGRNRGVDNERLEFLGDSVIGM